MKKTFLLILCAVLLFSTALAETATVTVNGVGEHVTVTLTMDGDRIAGVEASSDNTEADARGKESLALITKEMVSANTFSVDTISGATCTSNAVIAGAIEAWLQIMTDRMSQEEWMQESFKYEHDPRDNPKAMKDIVYNPAAVYGFSPSPDSTRLKAYVDALDWTNPDQVAEARAVRQAYHDSMSELYRMIERMLHEGKNVETIARAVSQRRNELRLESEADNPEALALTWAWTPVLGSMMNTMITMISGLKQIILPKVSDPCPCGPRKKYKKCWRVAARLLREASPAESASFYISLECVSKCREMQFRVDLLAFQGDFPQACWQQVKGRNAGKDAEIALQAF